ncbi:MarR family winged helix-turn-helix transcriptional regulator [Luethyella okanaganae]|uniref:MarR family winged helix-turn-helix transcriptional regulator n=1 Tax=Luethyella okanaganae TaxID=69372 RepID=A0ABW1VG24_9MICO
MAKTIAEQSSDLRMATLRLARRLRGEKADSELSDGQFSVLAALYVHGPHTLGALADRERISAPSMNRTVNCLEESGYLTRKTDTADRRKVNIALTGSGTAVVSETVKKRDAWLTRRMRELSADERTVLSSATEILRRLATQ